MLEEILSESEKYITILKKKIKPSKIKLLSSMKNKKILKYHSRLIYLISVLQDGRLASCSKDNNQFNYL